MKKMNTTFSEATNKTISFIAECNPITLERAKGEGGEEEEDDAYIPRVLRRASWAQNWVKIECCDYANQDVGFFLLAVEPPALVYRLFAVLWDFFFASLLRCFYRSGEREREIRKRCRVKSSESCSIQA